MSQKQPKLSPAMAQATMFLNRAVGEYKTNPNMETLDGINAAALDYKVAAQKEGN